MEPLSGSLVEAMCHDELQEPLFTLKEVARESRALEPHSNVPDSDLPVSYSVGRVISGARIQKAQC